jgi:prophage maintenance system killer protein
MKKTKNLNINTHLYTLIMKFLLNKKDIIALNQEFGSSSFSNEPSLDFALSYAKNSQNWTKSLAYLVRAINLDHVFEDGNKRTAALLIKAYTEIEGHDVYKDKVIKMIKEIAVKKISSIKKIEEMIQNAIK